MHRGILFPQQVLEFQVSMTPEQRGENVLNVIAEHGGFSPAMIVTLVAKEVNAAVEEERERTLNLILEMQNATVLSGRPDAIVDSLNILAACIRKDENDETA